MSLWLKIVMIVLWAVVICALVFTAFRFSWFAEKGTWVVKDAFDYDLTFDAFYRTMIIVCLWVIVFLAIVTLTEYIIFLYKQKHPKNTVDNAEKVEEKKRSGRRKRKSDVLTDAKEPAKDKIEGVTDKTPVESDGTKPSESNTSEAIAAKLRQMYYR